jgi:hypothetical protein
MLRCKVKRKDIQRVRFFAKMNASETTGVIWHIHVIVEKIVKDAFLGSSFPQSA